MHQACQVEGPLLQENPLRRCAGFSFRAWGRSGCVATAAPQTPRRRTNKTAKDYFALHTATLVRFDFSVDESGSEIRTISVGGCDTWLRRRSTLPDTECVSHTTARSLGDGTVHCRRMPQTHDRAEPVLVCRSTYTLRLLLAGTLGLVLWMSLTFAWEGSTEHSEFKGPVRAVSHAT
jgi:hypothetical protein